MNLKVKGVFSDDFGNRRKAVVLGRVKSESSLLACEVK
jgi:hypothetical protein